MSNNILKQFNLVVADSENVLRDVKFVRYINDSNTVITAYDTLKEYKYGDVAITSFSYSDLPAGGGIVSPAVLTYTLEVTQVGWSGNEYESNMINAGAEIEYSAKDAEGNPVFIDKRTGSLKVDDLGTTLKEKTFIATVTIKITANGKSVELNIDVYQEANEFVDYSYDTPVVNFDNTVDVIPASGGSVSCPTVSYSQVRHHNYTSGRSRIQDILTSDATVTYGTSTNPTESDNTMVIITGDNLGATDTDNTVIGTFYAKVSMNGESNENTINVVQSANKFIEFEYDEPTFTLGTVTNIPASGGTSQAPLVTNIQQTRHYCFSAGHRVKSDVITTSEDFAIYYGTSANPTSTNPESATKTADSLEDNETTELTPIGTAYVTVYMNGISTEKNTPIKQDINTFVEYEYDEPVLTLGSVLDIPASGGTSAVPSIEYTQTRYYCYTSGHKVKNDTISEGGTIYYGKADAPTSTESISCQFSADSLKDEVKDRTKVGTCYIKVMINDHYAQKTVDVYQAANEFINYSYDEPAIAFNSTVDVVPASGATRTCPATSYSQIRRYNYTSGSDQKRDSLTTGGTVTYGTATNPAGTDNTTVTITGSDLGATVKDATTIGTFYAKVDINGKDKECTLPVTLEANVFIDYSYDNPTGLSITCDLVPASGGSVTTGTVSGTCSQVRHYNYTSGNDKKQDTINPTYTGEWSGGASGIASRGTTEDAANTSTDKTLTYTYTANGKSNTATCTVYQQQNVKTGTDNYNGFTLNCYQAYTEYQVVNFASVGDIPASGGTSYAQGTGQSRTNYKGSSYTKYEIHNEYTSGSHAHNGSYTSASGWTDGNTPSATEWGGNTTVTGSNVTGASLGKTTTTAKTNRGNSTTTWNGVACSAAIYQAINSKSSTAGTALNARTQACYQAYTEYQIINFAALGDIPASGGKQKGQGTGQSRTNYKGSSYTKYDYYYTWTAYAGDSSAKEFSYSNTASGWTDGSTPSAGSWGGNTTVTGSEVSGDHLHTTATSRTKKGTSSYSGTYGSGSADIYQAANTYSDSWNGVTINSYSYTSSSFAAAGGTSSSPSVSASLSGTRSWTSGDTPSISNSSFSYSYSMSATGFSVNSSTGVVTAGNNTGAARSGTVTVTVTGAASKSATKTYTFSQEMGGPTAIVGGVVDFGLPSGTKWTRYNLEASTESDYGYYYQWPPTKGYPDANSGNAFSDEPSMSYSSYGTGRILSNNDDACYQKTKGSVIIPSAIQMKELYDNTSGSWTTINSRNGRKFAHKSNANVYIFLPASGYCNYGSLYFRGSFGNYWSSSLESSNSAYYMYFINSNIDPLRKHSRNYGCPLRGVQV